jgi:hypothetical protein
MKKLILLAMLIGLLIIGCARLTLNQVEQKYGPPAKKEVVNDKIIYYYYFSGRRLRIPYERYEGVCWEFTFDKEGKLINKRKYYTQPTLEK